MVLLITLVLTTSNVFAKEYISDDNVNVSTQYHDIFNNYFNEYEKYTYFPYSCSYSNYSNRTCYFGINEDGEFLDISYVPDGNSYKLQYSSGIDNSFSVTGSNVFIHEPSSSTIIAYCFVFVFLLVLIFNLIF